MDRSTFARHVAALSVGKRLPDGIYVHVELVPHLPDELQGAIHEARAIASLDQDAFQVIKLAPRRSRPSPLAVAVAVTVAVTVAVAVAVAVAVTVAVAEECRRRRRSAATATGHSSWQPQAQMSAIRALPMNQNRHGIMDASPSCQDVRGHRPQCST